MNPSLGTLATHEYDLSAWPLHRQYNILLLECNATTIFLYLLVVTTNVITPIVNTFERSGRSQICADKDIETAQQVVVTITTSPGKAQRKYILLS